ERLRQPRMWLLQPDVVGDGLPEFAAYGSTITSTGEYRAGVYDRYILLRTWLLLGGRLGTDQTIDLPADIDRLVSAVYEPAEREESDVAVQAELTRCLSSMQFAIASSETNAASVRIRTPEACDLLETSNVILEEDNPAVHSDLQASTRESDPSVVVVVLWQRGGQAFFAPDSTQSAELESTHAKSREQTNLLLQNVVTISQKSWTPYFLKQPVPNGWKKNSALCFSRALLLDSNGRFSHGQQYIEYDSTTGLAYGSRSARESRGTGESESQ
ncbi:MAG: hypothetical protein ACKO3T_24545, partial [Planctomycetaceae bacterium]